MRPARRSSGPSWLTLIGNMKDSLWSVDLFQHESIVLRTHWVIVVMDQHTRRTTAQASFSTEETVVNLLGMRMSPF